MFKVKIRKQKNHHRLRKPQLSISFFGFLYKYALYDNGFRSVSICFKKLKNSLLCALRGVFYVFIIKMLMFVEKMIKN